MKKTISVLTVLFCIGTLSGCATSMGMTSTEDIEGIYYEDGIYDTTSEVELEEDYSKLYYKGEGYTKFDDSMITGNTTEECTIFNVELTESQKKTISEMTIERDYENSIIFADFKLNGGGQMYFAYLKDDYIEEYYSIMQNKWNSAKINFDWPMGNTVTVSKDSIKAKSAEFNPNTSDDWFSVFAPIGDKNFGIIIGELHIKGNNNYYIDFNDAGIVYDEYFDIFEYDSLPAYEITDINVCEQIASAVNSYYNDSLGFLDNDDFTNAVADAFIVIVFAIIPFGILVVFTVLAIRSKTKYRKYFTVISAFAGIELIIFVILSILFSTISV